MHVKGLNLRIYTQSPLPLHVSNMTGHFSVDIHLHTWMSSNRGFPSQLLVDICYSYSWTFSSHWDPYFIWYMHIYIYDIWYMIYDVWYMIYDVWYMIYDIRYMVELYIYMYDWCIFDTLYISIHQQSSPLKHGFHMRMFILVSQAHEIHNFISKIHMIHQVEDVPFSFPIYFPTFSHMGVS